MDHLLTRLVAPAVLAAVSTPAIAANADLQDYFFQACASA
jgi:hypothetical protein